MYTIYDEYKDWLISTIEDDPLPYEIKYIYIVYGLLNGTIYLRFLGTEVDKGLTSDFSYNPLDAQRFDSKNLQDFFKNICGGNFANFEKSIKLWNRALKKEWLLNSFTSKVIKIKRCDFLL